MVPMLGLVAFMNSQDPKNSLDKLVLIIRNLGLSHDFTTRISILALVTIANLQIMKKYCGTVLPSIRRLPDIVMVVLGFTGKCMLVSSQMMTSKKQTITALSSICRWEGQGVAVFGSVPVTLGK